MPEYIVHLYKGKGDKSSCDNYREISLLSVAGKILSKVILNRLNTRLLDDQKASVVFGKTEGQ